MSIFMIHVHVKPGFNAADWEPGSLIYVSRVLLVDVLGLPAFRYSLSSAVTYMMWWGLWLFPSCLRLEITSRTG